MNPPRVLIAGIGNIFLGDDGFGVEVSRRLLARPQPEGVQVVDFGIRSFDLAYALLDGPELAILVDALARGLSWTVLRRIGRRTAADGDRRRSPTL
jgi:hydrogenase maturation protease